MHSAILRHAGLRFTSVSMVGTSVFQRLEKRWDRREEGLEPVIVQASITIAASPAKVWEFLMAPESALLVGDGILKAFRVPGTPVGVSGEQICIVSEASGRVSAEIAELVSVEPASALVARWVTSPNELVERTTLEPCADGRTSMTVQLAMRVAFGTSKKARPLLQAHLEQYDRRVRSAIESGAYLPSTTPAAVHEPEPREPSN